MGTNETCTPTTPGTGEELPTGESGDLVRELMASKGNDGRWRVTKETEVPRSVDPEGRKSRARQRGTTELMRNHERRIGQLVMAAATLAVLMPIAACTPAATSPTADGTATTPAPTQTPNSKPVRTPTPSLRPADRDKYAAVKAYYEAYDEVIAVLKRGGADRPTPTMRATMSGEFLANRKHAITNPGLIAKGTAQVDGYIVKRQKKNRIWMTVCENQRDLHLFSTKTGKEKDLGVTGLLVRDVIAIKGTDGRWRIDETVANEFVAPEDWRDQECMAHTDRPE